jgi:hypothetical protein
LPGLERIEAWLKKGLTAAETRFELQTPAAMFRLFCTEALAVLEQG